MHDEPTLRALRDAFGPERLRVELQRPFLRRRPRPQPARSPRSPRGSGCAAWRPATSTPTRRSRARCRTRSSPCRHHLTLESSEPVRRGNARHVLASPAAMAARFAEHPEAVAETARAGRAAATSTSPATSATAIPGVEDETAQRHARRAVRGAPARPLRGASPCARPRARLEEELRGDRRRWRCRASSCCTTTCSSSRARSRSRSAAPDSARALLPPGRGRGSSVSSIVCYLTGLSHIDPIANDLLDRPLPQRGADLAAGHRPRLPARHPRGADPARPRALRPRALGAGRGLPDLPLARRDPRARQGARAAAGGDRAGRARRRRLRRARVERDVAIALGPGARARAAAGPGWRGSPHEAYGLPRHLSQHSGGMIVSTRPLIDCCPVAAGRDGGPPARPVGQGLLRRRRLPEDRPARARDALGGRALRRDDRARRAASGSTSRGSRTTTRRPTTRSRTPRRPASSRSRAARRCSRCGARGRRTWRTSTIQVAIVRPGPIQGGAVNPYIERRQRLREDPDYEAPYEHPSLEPVLRETLGTIIFQDQVLEVAQAFAGFSPGEAEGLRRAMSRKRSERGDRALPPSASSTAPTRHVGVDRGARRAGLRDGRRASPASASPRPTAPPSACSPTSRPGCASTTAPSSSARCSTSSRWASTRPTASSTRPSGAGSSCAPSTSTPPRRSARSSRRRRRSGSGSATSRRARRGGRGARRRARAEGGPFRSLAELASRAGAGARRRSSSSPGRARATRSSAGDRARAAGAVAARRRRPPAAASPAAPSSRSPLDAGAAPGAARARPLGGAARRLRDHRRHAVTTTRWRSCARACAGVATSARARAARATARTVAVGGLVVARQRPETAERRRLHAARGRVRHDQPDRPARGLRAPPPRRPGRAADARRRAGSSVPPAAAARSTCWCASCARSTPSSTGIAAAPITRLPGARGRTPRRAGGAGRAARRRRRLPRRRAGGAELRPRPAVSAAAAATASPGTARRQQHEASVTVHVIDANRSPRDADHGRITPARRRGTPRAGRSCSACRAGCGRGIASTNSRRAGT